MKLRTAKNIHNAVHCGSQHHGACHNWHQVTVAARVVERAVKRRSRLVSREKLPSEIRPNDPTLLD